MKFFLILLMLVLSVNVCVFAESSPFQGMARKEGIAIIAKSLIEGDTDIVLGEVRYDSGLMLPPEPASEYYSVCLTLGLKEFFPRQNIDVSSFPERIWIQMDSAEVWSREKEYSHTPSLLNEGVWLCFLKPVDGFPKRIGNDSSEISKLLAGQRNKNPYSAAKDLGIYWLNKKTWFMPAFAFSVFRTDLSIEEVPTTAFDYPEYDKQQILNFANTRRQRSRPASAEFTISKGDLEEIFCIAKILSSDLNSEEKLNQIIQTKSVFATEVLRQLAMEDSEALNDKMRELKRFFPKDLLERLFSND